MRLLMAPATPATFDVTDEDIEVALDRNDWFQLVPDGGGGAWFLVGEVGADCMLLLPNGLGA